MPRRRASTGDDGHRDSLPAGTDPGSVSTRWPDFCACVLLDPSTFAVQAGPAACVPGVGIEESRTFGVTTPLAVCAVSGWHWDPDAGKASFPGSNGYRECFLRNHRKTKNQVA